MSLRVCTPQSQLPTPFHSDRVAREPEVRLVGCKTSKGSSSRTANITIPMLGSRLDTTYGGPVRSRPPVPPIASIQGTATRENLRTSTGLGRSLPARPPSISQLSNGGLTDRAMPRAAA